ncbi:MAG: zf-HC2 domain-containing protein [Elusimicrobia bacterium]|nr:zf-HC2 domain-containing protein [Elusimicrobiota bacterium]
MAHDFSVEDLSAFLDGELPAERRAQVAAHLGSCAACTKELERLKRASAAFRRHALEPLPPSLLGKALRRLRPAVRRFEPLHPLEYVLAIAMVVGVVLVSGVALKRFMPGLFSQIQTMISGAAGSLGQGH